MRPAPAQSTAKKKSTTHDRFTPCFDWVVHATGSSATALAYGVVWRYAQMRGRRCYASCARLSSELGWTRQRIMRHLRVLVANGLVTCLNPSARGVPHEYLPVSREMWLASCKEQHVPPPNTPCSETSPEPVPPCHTSNTKSETKKIPEGPRRPACPLPDRAPSLRSSGPKPDPRTRSAAIQAVRQTTGWFPAKVLYDQVIAVLGDHPDLPRLRHCYQTWCARGYNPRSLTWLLEWYVAGATPPQGRPPHGRARAGPLADPSTPADFARWRQYQERIQEGENPDEVRTELGL